MRNEKEDKLSAKTPSNSSTRYEKLKKLGEGTYGSVSKVYDHQLKQIRALKKIKFVCHDEGIPTNALREISLLKKISHPNIIKYGLSRNRLDQVHYNYEHNKLYLSLEYCEDNLYNYLKQNHPLSPYSIQNFMFQILSGLSYLHENGIMHRDLKSQNILINSEGFIKICDFGQAKLISIIDTKHTPQISTLWYRAPETLFGSQNYSFKVDLWAVGCIMAELITGDPIFKSNYQVGQMFEILTKRGGITRKQFQNWIHLSPEYPKIPHKNLQLPNIDHNAIDLLEKLLEVDPDLRIGTNQALKHPYFYGC